MLAHVTPCLKRAGPPNGGRISAVLLLMPALAQALTGASFQHLVRFLRGLFDRRVFNRLSEGRCEDERTREREREGEIEREISPDQVITAVPPGSAQVKSTEEETLRGHKLHSSLSLNQNSLCPPRWGGCTMRVTLTGSKGHPGGSGSLF